LTIVVSGNNHELLSREIATELRGRYRDVLMLRFSFDEFLRLKGVEYSKATFHTAARGRILAAFDEYLKSGGFPEVAGRNGVIERLRVASKKGLAAEMFGARDQDGTIELLAGETVFLTIGEMDGKKGG